MLTSRKKLATIATVILVLIVALLYLFVWRASDSDYKAATDQLNTLQTTSTAINKDLVAITSASALSDTVANGLQGDVTKYNAALNSLVNNSVLSKDQTVKTAYGLYGPALVNYHQTVSNTSTSIKQYGTVVNTCNFMLGKLYTAKTVAAFDTLSKSCVRTIGAVQLIPNSSFRSQYLDDYAKLESTAVAAYRQQITAGTDAKAGVSATSVLLGAQKSIDTLTQKQLTLTPESPASDIQKLQDVITAQSKSFIR